MLQVRNPGVPFRQEPLEARRRLLLRSFDPRIASGLEAPELLKHPASDGIPRQR